MSARELAATIAKVADELHAAGDDELSTQAEAILYSFCNARGIDVGELDATR